MEVVLHDDAIYSGLEDGDDIEVVGQYIDLPNSQSGTDSVLDFMINEPENEVHRKKKKMFTCLICTKRFRQNAGRYNHMKKVHNIYAGPEKAHIRCLEKNCQFTCNYKEKLQLHLSEEHEIDMEVKMKTFNNMKEFLRWKDEFERQEKSRFVKKSGSRIREEGIRVAYYYCSRSGRFVSHSKGLKQSKKKGTSKTNHHCTASITSVEFADGTVQVKICSTHYGHGSELQHLRLTKAEKSQIAEQLRQGVPRELVLDKVRASIGSDVERIHLITIKDVKNIEKAYKIQAKSYEKTNNMFYNLNVWITDIMNAAHCPVLYFSEEGTFNTKDHDVTLILMTTGQEEVLKKFGKGGIFYVNTVIAKNKTLTYCHSVRPHFIYITTLMVVDDLNEAMPVGFMVSSNAEPSKLTLFFGSIKKKIPDMSAIALLTDDCKIIYDIWCAVFQDSPCHLWSNRFVDSDWRENLICITDEELQVAIYEVMYSYLESPDPDKLKSLKQYVFGLQANVITNKFGNYLAVKYLGSEEMWAGCYAKRKVGVSAQLNMEMVCNEVEEFGQKKHWDRNFLVRIVQHLLKLVSDKQCIRQSKMQRQIQELPTHHKLALNIKLEAISQESQNSWRIDSVKDPKNIYSIVTAEEYKCDSVNCALYCSKCYVCVHQFQCSCKVYAHDKTMCKHIHAVAIKYFTRKIEAKSEETASIDSQCSQFDEERQLKNPELLLVQESLWRKVTESSKRRGAELTSEDNLLPIIEDVLRNNHIHKRKRGRPRKNIKESVQNAPKEVVKEVSKRKQNKITKNPHVQQIVTDDATVGSDSWKPRRINILRRNLKKPTY